MKSLVSVPGKELTGHLSLLESTLMKNIGGGGGLSLTRFPTKGIGPEDHRGAPNSSTQRIDVCGGLNSRLGSGRRASDVRCQKQAGEEQQRCEEIGGAGEMHGSVRRDG